jgi:hypothetical protein
MLEEGLIVFMLVSAFVCYVAVIRQEFGSQLGLYPFALAGRLRQD